ncbi:uncharacterized protein METZ01_LOCUS342566 [marine metagenome]|uniref:MotA/TolQ/ExbB proton channel domain-containing protein n=1 Tax=marine metagenome TaxID=408172 RepID=A0A382QXU5_9ZZZZ|tara:strand:+ start:97 stop:513 length:417 start_codon:yes stop_codon:yes gene_type:complete
MKLKTLRIMAIITGILGTTLLNRFLEGGALFMSLILICLLLSIYFMARGFLSVKTNPVLSKKMLALINDSGTLGLALGFFSAFLGLITGFDAIEASGNAEPAILAGGIKVALLSPLFGLFTFIVSRVGMLLLRLLQKN